MSLRLRASRQEKLSISAEALNVLQDELREEDDRFKEAVKAAEDSAILAEVWNLPVSVSCACTEYSASLPHIILLQLIGEGCRSYEPSY